MVYLPTFDSGANLRALRTLREVQTVAEEYRRTIETVNQFPTEEIFAARQAMEGLSSVVEPVQQMAEVSRILQKQSFPAIQAARTLAYQQEQIQSALSEVQSAVEAVRAITPQQWTLLAVASGVSIFGTTPLWASVPAAAPPVSSLPGITLPQIATILTGEAGTVASVTMGIAADYAEAIFADDFYRHVAMYIFAGFYLLMTNTELKPKEFGKIFFYIQPVLLLIKKYFVPDN